MTPLQGNELFRLVFVALTDTPLIGIALSAGITALIHSSAATMGIALVLAKSGLIPFHAALYIILGANIGTCATAFFASLRSPAEARRVASAHLLFKVFGVLLFLPFLGPYEHLVEFTATDLARQIANAHTLFNVIMAVLLLPFIALFSRLITSLVPEKAEEKKFGPMYLDEHVLTTPSLALSQATREVLRASDIVREMLSDAIKVFKSDDLTLIWSVKDKDNLIDVLDRQIRLYLTRLSSSNLTESQSHRAVALLEITRDLENIGDIIDRNLMPLAVKRINKGIMFSQEGLEEITLFHKKVLENFDLAISAFASQDRDLAGRVIRNKEDLAASERELVQAHLERLRKGLRESIETSHIHLDVIGNLARIDSLISHAVYPILEQARTRGREDVGLEQQ
jgi:phosphate:Na+ symporter